MPRSLEMLAELKRATSLYKRENYKLALEILESNFNERSLDALNLERQLLSLDLLAALSEKQGFLPNARRYARDMIRRSKKDIRGYLRLGRVLQLNPQHLASAVKVYEMALQKVTPLKEAHEEFLKRQLALCKTRLNNLNSEAKIEALNSRLYSQRVGDFSQTLPIELLRLIFCQLSLKERTKCCLVSRSWQEYLYSEPIFWSDLDFSACAAPTNKKVSVIQADTLIRYCNRSASTSPTGPQRPLHIDLQGVIVKDASKLLQQLAGSNANAPRLTAFKVNPHDPVSDKPLLRTLRTSNGESLMHLLRELKISSDSPTHDILWCLQNLPSLEHLDLTITPHNDGSIHPPSSRHLDFIPVCEHLTHIAILGSTGQQAISDSFLNELAAIPSLTHIDVHRVVELWWPCLAPALANPRLKRLGFTSGSVFAKRLQFPMPRFNGDLEHLTMNDVCINRSIPLILPDMSIWQDYRPGCEATCSLKYVELKRTQLDDCTLPQLLHLWGCLEHLEVLVAHSTAEPDSENQPNDDVFPNLQVLQYTSMKTLSDARLEWMISAFPNVQKANFDETPMSGPQLVRILTTFKSLRAIRCSNVMGLSPDTVAWTRTLPVTVIF